MQQKEVARLVCIDMQSQASSSKETSFDGLITLFNENGATSYKELILIATYLLCT